MIIYYVDGQGSLHKEDAKEVKTEYFGLHYRVIRNGKERIILTSQIRSEEFYEMNKNKENVKRGRRWQRA